MESDCYQFRMTMDNGAWLTTEDTDRLLRFEGIVRLDEEEENKRNICFHIFVNIQTFTWWQRNRSRYY